MQRQEVTGPPPPWIKCLGFNLGPHLQSGHVGGLQRLLQGLAEEIVTDRGPRRHRSHVAGGVSLNQRRREKTLWQTPQQKYAPGRPSAGRWDSHLAGGRRRDRAAVGGAGQSQGRRQLALGDGPRTRRPAVAQRYWTHARWASHSAGGSSWAPLLTNIHTLEEHGFELPHRLWVTHALRLRDQAAWLTDWKSSSSSDMPSNMKPPAEKKVGTFKREKYRSESQRKNIIQSTGWNNLAVNSTQMRKVSHFLHVLLFIFLKKKKGV